MPDRSDRIERFATLAVAGILLAGGGGLLMLLRFDPGGAGTPSDSDSNAPISVITADSSVAVSTILPTPEGTPTSEPTIETTTAPTDAAAPSEPASTPVVESLAPSLEATPLSATPRPQVTPAIAAAYGSFGDTLQVDNVSVYLDRHAPTTYPLINCEYASYVQEGRTELVSYEIVMTWTGDVVMPPMVQVGSVIDTGWFEEPNEQFWGSGLTYLMSNCKKPADSYDAVITIGPVVNPVPGSFWEFHFS